MRNEVSEVIVAPQEGVLGKLTGTEGGRDCNLGKKIAVEGC